MIIISQRNQLIIIASVVVALLLGLFLWLFFHRTAPAPKPSTTVATSTEVTAEPVEPIAPATPERQAEAKEYSIGMRQIATTFAERFASYSTDQPLKNIADLQPLMSMNLQQKIDGIVSDKRASSAPSFVGFSARSLSSKLVDNQKETGIVEVRLQVAKETVRGQAPEIFYQTMTLNLIKIGTQWRVDNFELK